MTVLQRLQSHRTGRIIFALMIREMSTTYGRSAFGYLWVILEPVAGILLLTLIFSVALRAPPVGTNFALYYATGMLPFMAYLDISQKIAMALRFSRPLLAFPVVMFIDTILARLLLNTLTQIVIISIVSSTIILGYRLDIVIDFSALFLALFLAFALGFSVGTLNCYLFEAFPVWERLWSIINRPLFFISSIFYLFETVPEPYSNFLWFNPLVHIIGLFRKGIYQSYQADFVSLPYVLGLCLSFLLLGLLLLRRHHQDLILK